MRQTREVLRLYLLSDLSSRKIQGATGVARTTVQEYIKRCKQSDITAETLAMLNDDTLRVKLFGKQTNITVKSGKVMPDYNIVHQELKQSKDNKTKVTLMFLWEIYNISHQWIYDNIPLSNKLLKQWLKSGFIKDDTLFPTESGTPQGGIISPLLTNMVLDGIESIVKSHAKRITKTKNKKIINYKYHSFNFVRYADV